MMAKITKGKGFKGVVNYILDKKGAELIDSEGIRLKSRNAVINSFATQAGLNPKLSKVVGHISLDFSAQDKGKLNNTFMLQIAKDYMERMGITNTQYIIGRHHDTDHPHIHIAFNRVDNNGRTISDQNDRYRSEKICKQLTEKYGLYFSSGKENVKIHRLKEPDKTKYEIYNSLTRHVAQAKSWEELLTKLKQEGISVKLKPKGNTNEIQGIIFQKNRYNFNGSKVDRKFSFSKIDWQLKENAGHHFQQEQKPQLEHENHAFQKDFTENTSSSLSGIFDLLTPVSHHPDEDENMPIKKKKKRPQYRPRR